MNDIVKNLGMVKDLLTNPVFWVLVLWVCRELYSIFKKRKQTLEEKVDSSIKLNTLEVTKLTLAIQALEIKLGSLEALCSAIPKLVTDLNVAHERIRQMEPRYGRSPQS